MYTFICPNVSFFRNQSSQADGTRAGELPVPSTRPRLMGRGTRSSRSANLIVVSQSHCMIPTPLHVPRVLVRQLPPVHRQRGGTTAGPFLLLPYTQDGNDDGEGSDDADGGANNGGGVGGLFPVGVGGGVAAGQERDEYHGGCWIALMDVGLRS